MKLSIVIAVCLMLVGCAHKKKYHFYSPKNEQCVTIINDESYRYIIDGYHDEIPDTNYVKVDLGEIDQELGDEVAGCWNKNNLKWSMVMNGVTIVDDKLDKNHFQFEDNFPRDEGNIPTLIDFNRRKYGCFSVSFEYGDLRTASGSISE